MTLVNLVKSDDQNAWQTLFAMYSPLVRYWTRRAKIPQIDEDDVVQDVFRSVHAGISRFEKTEENGSFRAWIWTITRNKIRDYFKTRANKVVASGGTSAFRMVNQAPAPESTEDFGEPSDDRGLVLQALELVRHEVQEQTFDAFWRSTVDGINPLLVAEQLGISVDSVYQAKSRVLRRLRDLLQ
ncbi:MAG: sigma-70 family RNA polymerase sigma factor [Pirellulaceae bacterium]|nr:sigma-70 family RNA polymerase sigma factor [Pirellulaceae bacterium]